MDIQKMLDSEPANPEDKAGADLLDALDGHGVRGATAITRAIERLIDAKVTKAVGMVQAQMPLHILTGQVR